MRTLIIAAISATFSMGCASEATPAPSGNVNDPPLVPNSPLPTTTGVYVSRYRVPVGAELVNAADYAIDHAEWTIVGESVTLHYNLPVGLVGGVLDVTFAGTLVPGATTVELAGTAGVGTCVASATSLVCREVFGDLGPLPISMAVVEQTAAVEYPGPVNDRIAVATVFGSDPIGIVVLDLQQPVIDDPSSGTTTLPVLRGIGGFPGLFNFSNSWRLTWT